MNTKDTDVSTKSLLTLMAEEMPRDAWPIKASHAVCAVSGRHGSMERVVFSKGVPVKDRYDGGWTMFYNRDTLEHNSEWTLNEYYLSAIPYDWLYAFVTKQEFFRAKAMTSTKEKQGMTKNKQRKKGDYIIISELSYDEKWQFINDCGNDGADLHPAFIYDQYGGYAIQWDYDDKLELWRGPSSLRPGFLKMDTKDVTDQYKASQAIKDGQYIYTMAELIQALAEESKKDPEGYALQFEWQGEFTGEWYNSEYPGDVLAAMSDDWPVRRKEKTFDVNIEGMPKHVALECEVTHGSNVLDVHIEYKSPQDAMKAGLMIEQGFGQFHE